MNHYSRIGDALKALIYFCIGFGVLGLLTLSAAFFYIWGQGL